MIAITGYGSESDREHSAQAGIHHHLIKPVGTGQLNRLLAEIAAKGVTLRNCRAADSPRCILSLSTLSVLPVGTSAPARQTTLFERSWRLPG